MRGSGGGFFGIVVKYHLKVYKKPEYIGMASHILVLNLDDVKFTIYFLNESNFSINLSQINQAVNRF